MTGEEIVALDGFVPFPTGASAPKDLVGQFQRTASMHADRTALVDAEGKLTYAELNGRVLALAAGASRIPVGRGARVAILAGQDRSAVIGMLGLLHAGCTYVVLDANDPEARLSNILAEAEPMALLATGANRELAEGLASDSMPVLPMEELLRTSPDAWEPPADLGDMAAYILFTSGTTGKPKGVVQSQAAVLGHIRNYTDNLRISPGDRLNMLAMHGYDAALMDLYGALLNGAALHVWNLRQSGLEGCSRMLRNEGITVFHSTPTVFRTLFREMGTAPASLRLVVLGGERTTTGDLRLFQEAAPEGCVLVNGLGPTECTIICQGFYSRNSDLEDPVPIGKPVAGLDISILGSEGRPMAKGEPGELVVRGPQVALGYHGNGHGQEGAFEQHADGTRSYRTGDLVKALPDGRLVFLGRKDGQMKLRGMRIEPSEVTAAINSHPAVGESAVVLRGAAGSEVMHAFIVPQNAQVPSSATLRGHVAKQLPAAWLPASFTALTAMPLRANGKLDTAALPELPSNGAAEAVAAPHTHLEKSIVMAWRHVLDMPVGLDSNFFEVGGSSLQGLRILARLGEVLGESLPLALIYQHPTVRELAQRLDGFAHGPRWSNLVPIRSKGSRTPLACVHGDDANYHLAQLLDPAHPFFAFFHQGEDGLPMVHKTFPDIVRHYAAELREVRPSGPLMISGYSYGGIIALELAHHLKDQGRDVPLLVIIDSQGPGYRAPTTLKSSALRVRDSKDRLRCRHYFKKGRPLPEDLRNFYIMDIYGDAMRQYEHRAWHGPALLVRCEARRHQPTGWDGILTDMETTVVPGDHRSIVSAQGVGPVVEAIERKVKAMGL